jgi:hypothetical protein
MRILILTAAIAALAACSQGPNEEAGEAADTAAEQATTGDTNLGQGPMEEAGEQLDQSTQGGATPATPPAETPATPPATTP